MFVMFTEQVSMITTLSFTSTQLSPISIYEDVHDARQKAQMIIEYFPDIMVLLLCRQMYCAYRHAGK